MADDPLPKERGNAAVALLARTFVFADRPHDLRDLGIGVFARQRVPAGGQRTQDLLVVETPCEIEVSSVAGQHVDVGQRLGHASVFANQDPRHLLVGEPGDQIIEPVGKADQHGQGLRVGRIPADIDQTGKLLVQGIERHPASVEVETLGTDVAAGEFGKQVPAPLEARQQTGALPFLTLGKGIDAIVDPTQAHGVARRCIHHRQGRKIVSESMARSPGVLPPAVSGNGCLQPRLGAETRKETVGVHRQEPAAVHLLGMEERAARDPDSVQRGRAHLRNNPDMRFAPDRPCPLFRFGGMRRHQKYDSGKLQQTVTVHRLVFI